MKPNPKSSVIKSTVTPEEIDIEGIMARSNTIESDVVKEALNDLQNEQRKKQKERILRVIAESQRRVNSAVSNLRSIRESEKLAKSKLEKLARAEANLVKTGDINAYANEIYPGEQNNYDRSVFLSHYGY